MRVARARVDHHTPVLVEPGERGLRLDGGVLVERRVEGCANLRRGPGESLLDVAPLHDLLREDVALLVNPDGVRAQCLVRRRHGRQHVIVDANATRRLNRNRLRRGDDGRDRIAGHADLVRREHGLILDDAAMAVDRHVGCREHGLDTGQQTRVPGLHGQDPRMRVRAPDDLQMQHAVPVQIGAVHRPAGHHVDLAPRVAERQRGRTNRVAVGQRRRAVHGVDNRSVSGAPAVVRAERPDDDIAGRPGIGVQQRLGRHQQAGRAEPALHGARLDERALHGVERLWRAEALDREDVRTRHLTNSDLARALDAAVHQDRARSASPVVASDLRSGEPQVVPQDADEPRAGISGRVVKRADDGQQQHGFLPGTDCRLFLRVHAVGMCLQPVDDRRNAVVDVQHFVRENAMRLRTG